jgi:undecaprenyl-diphosphatase
MLGGALAALLVAFFLRLAVWLRGAGEPHPIDEFVLALMRQSRTPFFNRVALDLTDLGSGAFLGLISFGVICVLLFIRRDRAAALQMAVASAGAGCWVSLGKNVIERSRPDALLAVLSAGGYSFPSGHTLSSAAIYLTIGLLAGRALTSRRKRLVVMVLTLLLIAVIGLTRIYLGVHFPTDVAGGILLGTAWALVVEACASFLRKRAD